MMEEAQAQSNSTNEDKEIDALQDAQAQEPEQQDNPQQLPAVSVADAELEAQNYKFGSKAEERLDPEMLVPAKEPEAKKEERGPNVLIQQGRYGIMRMAAAQESQGGKVMPRMFRRAFGLEQ
jgi:hypothetical protein